MLLCLHLDAYTLFNHNGFIGWNLCIVFNVQGELAEYWKREQK